MRVGTFSNAMVRSQERVKGAEQMTNLAASSRALTFKFVDALARKLNL